MTPPTSPTAAGEAAHRAAPGRVLPMGHRSPLIGLGLIANAAVLAAFYPGLSNTDMASEYQGLQAGIYADWHPPIMAALWRLMEPHLPGKAGLFVLFAAAHLGLCLLASLVAARVSRLTVVLVGLLLLFPPLLTQVTTLYKDLLMALLLGAAAMMVHLGARPGSPLDRVGRTGAACLACLGLLFRVNGVFAGAPLLIHAARQRAGLRLVAALSVPLSLALIPASQVVNEALFQPRKISVTNALFIFDFAGISAFSGENAFPEIVRSQLSLADNAGCYTPAFWDPFIDWRDFALERYGSADRIKFAYVVEERFTKCQAVWRLMRRHEIDTGHGFLTDWLQAILRHPRAYAVHRLSYFNEFMAFLVPDNAVIARDSEFWNGFGWTFSPSPLARGMIQLANLLAATPAGWPACWLALAIIILRLSGSIGDKALRSLIQILCWSGLFYTLAFATFGIAYGFRYHGWLVLSTGLAAALHLGDAARSGMLFRTLLPYLAWMAPIAAPILVWRIWDLPAPYLLLS